MGRGAALGEEALGYAPALMLSLPFVGPPLLEMLVLLARRRGARLLKDLAWLLGRLGFGVALMERVAAHGGSGV